MIAKSWIRKLFTRDAVRHVKINRSRLQMQTLEDRLAPALINYNESVSGDLANGGEGTPFTLDTVGVNTWTGKINTTANVDQQDWFRVTVAPNIKIVGVSFNMSNSFNGGQWGIAGLTSPLLFGHSVSGAGSISLTNTGFNGGDPPLPILPSTFSTQVHANLAVDAPWTVTYVTSENTFGPSVTTHPNAQTISLNGTATFTAAATSNPAPTVQWQERIGSGSYANISNGTVNGVTYSGVTSGTLNVTANNAAANGRQYRAVFTNSQGSTNSGSALLTVNSPATVTTHPSNATVPTGSQASFTAAATGNPSPSVQWQVSTGGPFSNISGATGTTYAFTTTSLDQAKQYRAAFTNSFGTVYSNPAILTLQTAPTVTGPTVSNISATTATLGGTVTSDGSASITARGVAWSLTSVNQNPQIGGSGVLSGATGGGTGGFTVNIGSLAPFTSYTYVAFATNSQGTSYTAPASFTTAESPSLVVSIATDTVNAYDGKTSLREALAYAEANPGADTITFAPGLAGQTITVADGWNGTGDDTALRVSTDVTIDGGTGFTVNQAAPVSRRLFLNGGTLTLRNLTLSGGDISATGEGGALWSNSTANLVNVRMTANKAFHGGAIWNSGTLNITDSKLDGNSATGSGSVGGAIQNHGSVTILRGELSGNSATHGGAVNSGNNVSIQDSILSSNSAGFNGGALRLFGAGNAITGSTLHNNTAANGGGAVISHGTLTITNSTFAHNIANDGGAVQCFEGTASIQNATMAYNTAVNAGGGLIVNFADVTLRNTLIAGNAATDQASIWGSINGASTNNLTGSAAQALIALYGNFGGSQATVALLPGSPAINAGTVSGAPVNDQRGKPRVGIVDIGAVESQGYTLSPLVTSTPQTVGAGSAFLNALAVSVAANNPGEPVQGGIVTFSAPVGGASATFASAKATINSEQLAMALPTANGVPGSYTATASVAGASANFSLSNLEAQSLTVTMATDTVDPLDSKTSLREAVAFAQQSQSLIGFGHTGAGWTLNKGASGSNPVVLPGSSAGQDTLIITSAEGGQANSTWFNQKVNVGNFTASFRYSQSSGTSGADGFTLAFQNAGLNAVGGAGGALGYAGIAQSVGFAFNIYNSGGSVQPGIALFNGGGTTGGVYTTIGNGVSLTNGQPVDITLTGNGSAVTLTMMQGSNTFTNTFNNLNIADAVGGTSAYLGFTGATGGSVAQQRITNFQFSAAPSPATVSFAPVLAGQTVILANGWNNAGDTASLRIAGDVTLQGPTTGSGVTIAVAPGVPKRHLFVESNGRLTASHLTFKNGAVSDYGGAIWNFGALTVRNSTFSGNQAGADGGAIHSAVGSQSLTLQNSTFANNSAPISTIATGAAANDWDHLTVVDNTAGPGGGAFDIYQTTALLRSSIVARNTNDGALTGLGNGSGGFAAGSANNLLGNGAWGSLANGVDGNIINAPLLNLGTLADNGGPTPTVAVLAFSPAINKGGAGTTTDQRGQARVDAPDIGAYESPFGAPTDITLSNASVIETAAVNTLVGSFSTIDPNAGDSFTYTLVSGTGSSGNSAFTIAGNQLRTAANFAGGPGSYSIRVFAMDQTGLATEKVFTIAIANAAPTVTGIVVNDGAVQRSRVTSLKVTFSEIVNVTAASFTLLRTGPDAPGVAGVSVDLSGSTPTQTVARLTFNGALSVAGSLIDGQYRLTVNGNQYTDLGSQTGSDAQLDFRRLFGDSNADGNVNAIDFADFGNFFGGTVANSPFDFEGNGQVNALDLAEFGNRFGVTL